VSTPVFYFYGGEDVDFTASGGSFVSTAAGTFRSGVARCALVGYADPGVHNGAFWSALDSFTSYASSLWLSAECWTQFLGHNNANDILRICDGAVPRIRVESSSTGAAFCTVYKQNAAGAATSLGTIGQEWIPANAVTKMDVQLIYSTTGMLNIYQNNTLIFSYVGDVTTDGTTVGVNGLQLGSNSYLNSSFNIYWSEVIVSDSDTRGMAGLVTLAPVANGNTHNFDVGSPAASHVNKISIDDSTYDGASASGLIDQYTIGSLPAGSWQITSLGIRARAEIAAFGGPLFQPGVRSGSTDFWGSSFAMGYTWQNNNFQSWEVDPTTGAPWSDLPVNIGLKAA
jgi:hypothetical protein